MGMISGQDGNSWTSTDTTATDIATRDSIASPHLRQVTDGSLVWSDAPTKEWLADRVVETAVVMKVADRILRHSPEGATPDLYEQAVTLFRAVLPYTASMSYETLGQLADIAYGTTDGRATDATTKDDELVTMLVRSLSEYRVPSGMVARNADLLAIVQEFEEREARARTDYDTPAPDAIAQPITEITPELIGWTTSTRYAESNDPLGIARSIDGCRPLGSLLSRYPNNAKLAMLQAALGHDQTSNLSRSASERIPSVSTLNFIVITRTQRERLSDELFSRLVDVAALTPSEAAFDDTDPRHRLLSQLEESFLFPGFHGATTLDSEFRAQMAQFRLLGRPDALREWTRVASDASVESLWSGAVFATRWADSPQLHRHIRTPGGARFATRSAAGGWAFASDDAPTIARLVELYASAFSCDRPASTSWMVAQLARTPSFYEATYGYRSTLRPLAPYLVSQASIYIAQLPHSGDRGRNDHVTQLTLLAGDAIKNLHSRFPNAVETTGLEAVAAAFDKQFLNKRGKPLRHNPPTQDGLAARSSIEATLLTRAALGKLK